MKREYTLTLTLVLLLSLFAAVGCKKEKETTDDHNHNNPNDTTIVQDTTNVDTTNNPVDTIPLSLISLSPNCGDLSTTFQLTGTGFESPLQIYVNAQSCSIVSVDSTLVLFTLPQNVFDGNYPLVLVMDGQTVTSDFDLCVSGNPPLVPVVNEHLPYTGNTPGGPILLMGQNFSHVQHVVMGNDTIYIGAIGFETRENLMTLKLPSSASPGSDVNVRIFSDGVYVDHLVPVLSDALSGPASPDIIHLPSLSDNPLFPPITNMPKNIADNNYVLDIIMEGSDNPTDFNCSATFATGSSNTILEYPDFFGNPGVTNTVTGSFNGQNVLLSIANSNSDEYWGWRDPSLPFKLILFHSITGKQLVLDFVF
jgi:IPT/TIG domain